MQLNLNEIFRSIQGEGSYAGFPALFIRLAGCNLNCHFCDTKAALKEGKIFTIDKILNEIKKLKSFHHILITGGEPLLQENIYLLIEKIISLRCLVLLETNGSFSVKNIPSCVKKIIDVKTPSSGHAESFCMDNLKYLEEKDELKFIISDRNDFNYAVKFIKKNISESNQLVINFSPAFNTMSYSELAQLIIKENLIVRLNLQLHKIIWPGGEPKNL